MPPWGEDDAEPAALGLVVCRHSGGCLVCDRDTCWRAASLDIHVCSRPCYEAARDFLEARHTASACASAAEPPHPSNS